MATEDRGLGSPHMDPKKKHDIQSKGGHASGGNFANDPERASEAGKIGGQHQGKENNPGNFANDRRKAQEAGKKGGHNSHQGQGA